MTARSHTTRAGLAALVLALLLGACGAGSQGLVGQTGDVRWRDVAMTLPPGWVVTQDTATAFTANDKPLPEDPEAFAPGGDGDVADLPEAGMYVTVRDGVTIQDWRDLVQRQGGTVHTDSRIMLGGVPADLLEFSQASNDVPTRERVVIIPSRRLEVLLQPIPALAFGEGVGPELFAEHEEAFSALVASFRLGAPVE